MGSSKERRDSESLKSEPGAGGESPVVAVRRKISATMERVSSRLRSLSDERPEDEGPGELGQRRPSLLRRSISEGDSLRRVGVVAQDQVGPPPAPAPSSESLRSEGSTRSTASAKGELGAPWGRAASARPRRRPGRSPGISLSHPLPSCTRR